MREPARPIRVITINTWKGDGPYAARLEALGAQLRCLQPDVVAMQEALVAVDGSLSTPDCLASALGMRALRHDTRRKPRIVEGRDVDTWSGLTILTRWPALEVTSIALPAVDEDGERAVLFAALDTPAGVVRIANAHLTHLRGRSELRRAQLEAALAHPFLRRPAAARLLCGDMNATPGTPEIAWLLGARETHGWHALDTYESADGPALRATMSNRNPHASGAVGERVIDYIFSLAPDEAAHPLVSGARVVLDCPAEGGVYPSDHFGVTVCVGGDCDDPA